MKRDPREEQAQRNRERFPTAAELMDWANKHFPCTPGTQGHRITYASNARGEEIGKR
jgi:hypothetical protein